MSETRKILEAKLRAAPQADSLEVEHIINQTDGEQARGCASPEADPYLEAPKSFKKEFAEAFRSLTPEMRKYLHERESENTKGFSRLNNELQSRKWIDDFYASRQERLRRNGMNSPREWMDYLAKFDDAFAYDPESALNLLAQKFNLAGRMHPSEYPNRQYQDISQRLASLEEGLRRQRMIDAQEVLAAFANARDDAGELKHPHYEAVKAVIGALLGSGVASDLESAYEQAIWSDKNIRNELMKAKTESELKNRVSEAQKARQAGFNPKGKPYDEPEAELTTRQLLAKKLGIADMI